MTPAMSLISVNSFHLFLETLLKLGLQSKSHFAKLRVLKKNNNVDKNDGTHYQ